MPIRKLADLPTPPGCRHPDHSPPKETLLDAGLYENLCPRCSKLTRFVVPYRGSIWVEGVYARTFLVPDDFDQAGWWRVIDGEGKHVGWAPPGVDYCVVAP